MNCTIPNFPEFVPIELAMRDELHDFCSVLPDGLCELPFAAIFLLRHKYRSEIARLSHDAYALIGVDARLEKITGDERFFEYLSQRQPSMTELDSLFQKFPNWKSMPQSSYEAVGAELTARGFSVVEDRDNFDYLYERESLASLSGKKFHKKKNLVNAYCTAYACEALPLTKERFKDVQYILDAWQANQAAGKKTDYGECKEALDNMETLGLDGIVTYADGKPSGFSLGERIAAGTIYCVHFEKGIDTYKGVFQYVNQATAKQLPEVVRLLNREQDLGDEGLRQAKETYRPSGYVVKYLASAQPKERL
jgi:hypothetical protein